MITLCTVTLDRIKKYEDILIESVFKNTKLISEVVLADNDRADGKQEWVQNGIKFKKIGSKIAGFDACGDQHALGLHAAMSEATNDLVYWCDPDIFFYSSVDQLYYELKTKYELNVVGCSHHSATELAGTFFPWHGNLLVSKKDLPPTTWMDNNLRLKGKYLLAGAGIEFNEKYPNPKGNFDTASALWLWGHEQNWKWLSFQTLDAHLYTTKYYRGNSKLKDRLPMEKLIYHAVSGSIEVEKWNNFKKAYDDYTMHSST